MKNFVPELSFFLYIAARLWYSYEVRK